MKYGYGGCVVPFPRPVRKRNTMVAIPPVWPCGTTILYSCLTAARASGDWAAASDQLSRGLISCLHIFTWIISRGLAFLVRCLMRPKRFILGPRSAYQSLFSRLSRYLSPPLFPVLLRDLPCKPHLHEIGNSRFRAGPFEVQSGYIIHPGPTVGYRVKEKKAVFTYMPDHEPALGGDRIQAIPNGSPALTSPKEPMCSCMIRNSPVKSTCKEEDGVIPP